MCKDIIKDRKTKPSNKKQVQEDAFAQLSTLDPWADWKPNWTVKSKSRKHKTVLKTVHDFQEQHSPTIEVKVKSTKNKPKTTHQQRIVNARLWESMSSFQQDASIIIEHSFISLTKGLGYRTSDPSRIPCSGSSPTNATERQSEMIRLYFKWATKCTSLGLNHSACMDILAYGHSCRHIDKNRRVRNGWTRKNLFACLNAYCEVRGWPYS